MIVWGRVLALAGRRRFGWGVFGLFAMLLSMHGVDAADAPYLAVVPPAVASRPALKYPPQAIAARHQGEVMLLIVVGKDGEPKDIRVDHGSGFPELDAAAVEAVEQWKFKPELKFGIPVQSTIKLPVDFNLSILSGDRLPIATGALSDELLRIELPQGNAFTASLETGNLIPSHHVPFKPLAGQHAFPGLPPDPSGYAQTLETAYHNAYVAASSHAEPPASRCLINCLRTLWLAFKDGSALILNVQDNGSQAGLMAIEGLPSAEDAKVAANMAVYLHQHPGLDMRDWELREKTGDSVNKARLYYYDMPKDRVSAMQRLAIGAPLPPPAPPVPDDASAQEVCRRTLVKGAEHTIVESAAQIPVVTVVVDRSGQVEHEWIARSSGAKMADSSALNDAAHWTFNGIACEGQRVTESVGMARR
jgi:TonB family protein